MGITSPWPSSPLISKFVQRKYSSSSGYVLGELPEDEAEEGVPVRTLDECAGIARDPRLEDSEQRPERGVLGNGERHSEARLVDVRPSAYRVECQSEERAVERVHPEAAG